MDKRVSSIVSFWFGQPPDYLRASDEKMKLWFGGNEATNELIRQQFSSDHQQARSNQLDFWEHQNESAIALILLLDQFSRNIFKGTADAFACDSKALAISKRIAAAERDCEFMPLQRLFLYLPFEHSEELSMQNISVFKFSELAQSVSAEFRDTYNRFTDYAIQHQQVIERFGRFPHRNKMLNRQSTHEEIEFLENFTSFS